MPFSSFPPFLSKVEENKSKFGQVRYLLFNVIQNNDEEMIMKKKYG